MTLVPRPCRSTSRRSLGSSMVTTRPRSDAPPCSIPLATGRIRHVLRAGRRAREVELGMSVASGMDGRTGNRSTILDWEVLATNIAPTGGSIHWSRSRARRLYSVCGTANVDVDVDGDGSVDRVDKRQRNHSGLYAGLEVQPFRRWAGGFRYDWVGVSDQSGLGVGPIEPYVLVLAVRIPPLPAGLQAHPAQSANPRRLQPERLERPDRGRAPLPGDLHPRRASRASLLGGDAC